MSILGKLFLLVGPSGVGKGATIKKFHKNHPEYRYPKSMTTRPMREEESEGNPYHFVTSDTFQEIIKEEGFLEHAIVHEQYHYGTPKQPIFEALNKGETIIKELDIQGFVQTRESFNKEPDEIKNTLVSIFILPPSEETLRKRIKHRSEISEEELDRRMESLRKEVAQSHLCDIQIQFTEEDTIQSQYEKVEAVILDQLKN